MGAKLAESNQGQIFPELSSTWVLANWPGSAPFSESTILEWYTR